MSEVKRFGHIGSLIQVTPKILEIYPSMTVYVLAADFDRLTAENQALQQRLTTADQRIDEQQELLREAHDWVEKNNFGGCDAYDLRDRLAAALNPTTENPQ